MSKTFEVEASSPIPAKRMYKAFVLDGDNLLPKVLPDAVKSIKIIKGDGGVGTVKLVSLPDGDVKHRVDAIDEEKMTYSYNIIEGTEVFSDAFEATSYHVEIVPTSDGGCIMKNRCTYKLKGDEKVAEDHIKILKEQGVQLFKAVEAYLLAHPNEY